MKGVVFTVMQKMVEENLGLAVWDQVVTNEELASGGSYTAAASYDDSELIKIVSALSVVTKQPVERLVRTFGGFMLKTLAGRYPDLFAGHDLKSFLLSVDRVIHVEVRKLYPGAELPEFQYEEPSPGRLLMHYRSRRKLCVLAEGLILGASEHFGERVDIKHPRCMIHGADSCLLDLTISSGPKKAGDRHG